jgi:hypothetical protein
LVRPLAGLTGKKVWSMQPEEPGPQLPPGFSAATGWQAMVFVGVVAVIVGLIVALHPGGSLTVIAVLLGVLLVISGIFDLVRGAAGHAASGDKLGRCDLRR